MSKNLFPNKGLVRRHSKLVVWLTGLSGSGKSTIANELELSIHNMGHPVYVLDGDNVRTGLNSDLDFSDEGRKENIRRISEVAKLFSDSSTLTITAFISPFKEDRDNARKIIGDNFVEVFVDTSLEVCEERDVKGLYARARSGEIKNFTGIDSPYENPENPDLVVKAGEKSIEECVSEILEFLGYE